MDHIEDIEELGIASIETQGSYQQKPEANGYDRIIGGGISED